MAPQDRSLANLARTRTEDGPGSTLSQLKEWSRTYGWTDRAAAWDDELDRRKRAMFVDERELIFRRQLDLVRRAIDKVAEAVAGADLANVTFAEAVCATDTLVRLERSMIATDAVPSVPRQPEPAPPPAPTQKTASVLRIFGGGGRDHAA